MVEGTGLENRHTGNGIVSSNLTPSVRCRAAGAAKGFLDASVLSGTTGTLME